MHSVKKAKPGGSTSSATATGGPVAIKKSTLLSFEEPHFRFPFSGRNETAILEVDGWARRVPLKFDKLKSGLIIKTISPTTPPSEMPIRFNGMMSMKAELEEISAKVGRNKSKLSDPALVTIIAKKTIDFIIKDKGVLMFGEMLAGDETGYCRLITANDSISTVYQQVQVGDKLIIGVALVSEPFMECLPSYLCLDSQHFLNFDMRMGIYDSRSAYKLEGVDDGKLPSYYTQERKIFTVTELMTPSMQNCVELEGKPEIYTFDVIGVVSYVGRLERRRECRCEVLLDKDNEPKAVPFFSAFRWIELVDRHSGEPLPVLFYVGTDNWDIQSAVLPGSLLLVTNVRRHFGDMSPSVISTRFSKMYINRGIESYLSLFPDSAQLNRIRAELFGHGAKFILGRADLELSAGGSYSREIADEQAFIQNFICKPTPYARARPAPPPNRSLCRFSRPDSEESLLCRESVRHTFKGYILKFQVVTAKGREDFILNRNPEMREEYNEIFTPDRKLASSMSFFAQKNWYMFRRQLPKIALVNAGSTGKSKSKPLANPMHTYENVSAQYKAYCEPLLMPAQGDPNLLKDLPSVDCFPHIWIQVVNSEVKPHEQYTCIWKQHRSMPLERMVSKLEKLVNVSSLCVLVDVHFTGIEEENKVFEVILQDVAVLQGQEKEATRED